MQSMTLFQYTPFGSIYGITVLMTEKKEKVHKKKWHPLPKLKQLIPEVAELTKQERQGS